MDKITYLFKYIYRLWGMAGRLTDEEGGIIAAPSADFSGCDPVFRDSGLLNNLRKRAGRVKLGTATGLMMTEAICIMWLTNREDISYGVP